MQLSNSSADLHMSPILQGLQVQQLDSCWFWSLCHDARLGVEHGHRGDHDVLW